MLHPRGPREDAARAVSDADSAAAVSMTAHMMRMSLRCWICLSRLGLGGLDTLKLTRCLLWNPPDGFPLPTRLCLSLCSSSNSAASSAMPKSPNFTASLPLISRLPGLMSRCRIPAACTAARPSARPRAILATLGHVGRHPCRILPYQARSIRDMHSASISDDM